ncbi:hypothetical protein B566_EDAN003699 [Ephemera danica]|nr:hypothetical protein B566_EDAN003699 [Ephemera danica]
MLKRISTRVEVLGLIILELAAVLGGAVFVLYAAIIIISRRYMQFVAFYFILNSNCSEKIILSCSGINSNSIQMRITLHCRYTTYNNDIKIFQV